VGSGVGTEEIDGALKGAGGGLSESHIEEEGVIHSLALITFLSINYFVFLRLMSYKSD
jgi:hypothetical protein